MLDFRYATIEDKEWVSCIFKNSGNIGADNCFGSLFLWEENYKCKIARYDNFLFRLYDGDEIYYSFPVGSNEREFCKKAIEILVDDAKFRNVQFKMLGITGKMKDLLVDIMPNKFRFEEKRDMFDYIYLSLDLANLSGKKYHSKRNHISNFKKSYNWVYKDIDNNNLRKCEEFLKNWFLANDDRNLEPEKKAVDKAMKNYFDLDFLGGFIEVDNEIVALTIGERINDKVFDIHFEKALRTYKGAYTVINQEFVKRNLLSYMYINREEDLGLEGLRKSKLSYNPVFLLDRYNAYWE